MLDRCPHCGVLFSGPTPTLCPDCLRPLESAAPETGIVSNPSHVEAAYAEGAPRPSDSDEEAPSIVRPAPAWPGSGALVLVIGSTGLGALQGALASGGFPRLVFNSVEAGVGAVAGLLIGLILACDHWFFQRRLNEMEAAFVEDRDAGLDVNLVQRPGERIAAAMIALPILAGIVLWFAGPLRLTSMMIGIVGSGTIFLTAVLGYFSLRQMTLYAVRARIERSNAQTPGFAYLGILGFWLICFPLHFATRKALGGRNLIVPGLVATGVLMAPLGKDLLVGADLPGVDNPDVLDLVRGVLEDEPDMRPVTLQGATQVAFDEAAQKRTGRCAIVTPFGKDEVTFVIMWQDRSRGMFQVQVIDRLPAVDQRETLELVKSVVVDGENALGVKVQVHEVTVRDVVQLRFDAAKQRRVGRAVVNLPHDVRRVFFTVEWADPQRHQFIVRVFPRDPDEP